MMRGLLSLTTARSFDIVTLTEAKAHLRVDTTDEDTLIDALIDAAHEVVEREANLVLAASTWLLKLPDWPSNFYSLRPGPVSSVTSIKYYDVDGTLQTLSSSYYRLAGGGEFGSRLEWVENLTLPSLSSRDSVDVVRIEYVQGYANAAAVPAGLKQAALLIIGHYFENREDVITGTIVAKIPRAAESLISLFGERNAYAS